MKQFRSGVAAEDADLRSQLALPGDDVGLAVAIHIGGRDKDSFGEATAEGEERAELGPRNSVEDADMRRGPGPGAAMMSSTPSPFTSPFAT